MQKKPEVRESEIFWTWIPVHVGTMFLAYVVSSPLLHWIRRTMEEWAFPMRTIGLVFMTVNLTLTALWSYLFFRVYVRRALERKVREATETEREEVVVPEFVGRER